MNRDFDPKRQSASPRARDPGKDLQEARALARDLDQISEQHGAADELKQRAIESEVALEELARTVAAVGDSLHMRSLIERILDLVLKTMRADRGVLFLGRGEEGALVPVLARSIEGRELERVEGVSRSILAQGRHEPLLSHDAIRDARFRRIPSVEIKQIRSVACAPIMAGGRCLGVIYIDAARPDAFPSYAERFLRPFGQIAGVAIRHTREYGRIARENERLRRRMSSLDALQDWAAASPRLRGLLERAGVIALLDEPVLIRGEPGTERELLARAIHELGPRSQEPFVGIDCAEVTRELARSLLPPPSARAAMKAKNPIPGFLRRADRGTLFLDEVTELDRAAQARLGRLLVTGLLRSSSISHRGPLDVRLITATGRDISASIGTDKLREDLYYRLSPVELHIPPLRERRDDIPMLVDHFLHKHSATRVEPAIAFTPAALEFLQSQSWPGNTAQLEDLVQRVLILSDRGRIGVARLKRIVRTPADDAPMTLGDAAMQWPERPLVVAGVKTLAEQEREAIRSALLHAKGNKSKAARLLGIHRNTLLRRIRRLEDA